MELPAWRPRYWESGSWNWRGHGAPPHRLILLAPVAGPGDTDLYVVTQHGSLFERRRDGE